MAPDVLLYTKSYCPFCRRAKAKFVEKGAKFREIDIEEHPDQRRKMINASGGRKTVPQIFIGGRHIGGADDLLALDAIGELDRLLAVSLE